MRARLERFIEIITARRIDKNYLCPARILSSDMPSVKRDERGIPQVRLILRLLKF